MNVIVFNMRKWSDVSILKKLELNLHVHVDIYIFVLRI